MKSSLSSFYRYHSFEIRPLCVTYMLGYIDDISVCDYTDLTFLILHFGYVLTDEENLDIPDLKVYSLLRNILGIS